MLQLWKEKIEKRLRDLLKPFNPDVFYRAMSYYPFQEGKRIRPMLVCIVADAYGGDIEDAITAGCAIEFLHNYSLIHDDLPCMDNDAFRRGLPSCHVAFGEDLALLAGDALLTFSFEVLSDKGLYKTLTEGELLLMVNILSKKAGFMGMVGGQVLDIRKLGDQDEITLKKTAELFSACFIFGGIVGKRLDLLEELDTLGKEFGIFFQMIDDYKDKDGYYQVYSEGVLHMAEKKLNSIKKKAQELSVLTEHFLNLLQMFEDFVKTD